MSHRVLWWINGVVILLVSVILFVHFAFVPSQTAVQPERPGPAA